MGTWPLTIAETLVTASDHADVASVRRFAVMFLIVSAALLFLFLGIVLLTRSRRRLRSATATRVNPVQPDPWKESANRVRIDETEPDERFG